MGVQFFEHRHGKLYEGEQQMYPSVLSGHSESETRLEDDRTQTFGFVFEGLLALELPSGTFTVGPGMYFSVPGRAVLRGPAKAALFQRYGYRGLFSLGGPVEKRGRLNYVDGCTTTLICPPARNGDPCLNLLSFPPETKQTSHIHPTLRLGAVIGGSGTCVLKSRNVELRPGVLFALEEGEVHCFHSGSDGLQVVAYHPDSEGGPTDQSHPMLNRTYFR